MFVHFLPSPLIGFSWNCFMDLWTQKEPNGKIFFPRADQKINKFDSTNEIVLEISFLLFNKCWKLSEKTYLLSWGESFNDNIPALNTFFFVLLPNEKCLSLNATTVTWQKSISRVSGEIWKTKEERDEFWVWILLKKFLIVYCSKCRNCKRFLNATVEWWVLTETHGYQK